jgi:hypothetical protein
VAPGCGHEPIGPGFCSVARATESRDRPEAVADLLGNGLGPAVIAESPDFFWISWSWGESFANSWFDPSSWERPPEGTDRADFA